jgi:hypothetical protein
MGRMQGWDSLAYQENKVEKVVNVASPGIVMLENSRQQYVFIDAVMFLDDTAFPLYWPAAYYWLCIV